MNWFYDLPAELRQMIFEMKIEMEEEELGIDAWI